MLLSYCEDGCMEEKSKTKKMPKWLWIFLIVCFVIIIVLCINDKKENTNNKNNGEKTTISEYDKFIKKAQLTKEYIFVNEYSNAKYIAFDNLDNDLKFILLYDNGSCQIYYNNDAKEEKANVGKYKVVDNYLEVYNYKAKIIGKYKIVKHGIRVNYNGIIATQEARKQQ
jgi:preprotein translocase subunit SecG